jgi:hypothetical protein
MKQKKIQTIPRSPHAYTFTVKANKKTPQIRALELRIVHDIEALKNSGKINICIGIRPNKVTESRQHVHTSTHLAAIPVEGVPGLFAIRGAFHNPLGYFESLPSCHSPRR